MNLLPLEIHHLILSFLDVSTRASANLVCKNWTQNNKYKNYVLFTQIALKDNNPDLFWLGIEWGLPLHEDYFRYSVKHGLDEITDYLIKEGVVYDDLLILFYKYNRKDLCLRYPDQEDVLDTMANGKYAIAYAANNVDLFREALAQARPCAQHTQFIIKHNLVKEVHDKYPAFWTAQSIIANDLVDLYTGTATPCQLFGAKALRILAKVTGIETTDPVIMLKELYKKGYDIKLDAEQIMRWLHDENIELLKLFIEYNYDLHIQVTYASSFTSLEYTKLLYGVLNGWEREILLILLSHGRSVEIMEWLLESKIITIDRVSEGVIEYAPELLDKYDYQADEEDFFGYVIFNGERPAWEYYYRKFPNMELPSISIDAHYLSLEALWWLVDKGIVPKNKIEEFTNHYHVSVKEWLLNV